jgi:hypothetical protein
MLGLRPSIEDEYIARATEVARARVQHARSERGELPEVLLAASLAADADSGPSDGFARLLVLPRELASARTVGDATERASELLVRASAASGRERVDLLEAAWRLVPCAAIAELVLAADGSVEEAPFVAPKRKADIEARWIAAAAEGVSPRTLFRAEWPTQWRPAQRRMTALYGFPASPRLAEAAVELARSEPKPYTSIASQVFWQGLAWFIAEQRDIRQLDALRAFELELARFVDRKETPATDALAAFVAGAPRDVPTALRPAVEKLHAQLGPRAATKAPSKTAPADVAARLVWADELMAKSDPRGELVVVQEQIATKEPTPALLERQAALLLEHAETWCPPSLDQNSCVFRRGAPAAGHLVFRSDRELASLAGAPSLLTLRTVIIDGAFAMGRIRPETVAAFARSIPLETVLLGDESAQALARGEPSSIEHVRISGKRAVELDGPGLPKLRRLDFDELRPRWLSQAWFQRLDAIGCTSPEDWLALREHELPGALVLCQAPHPLRRMTPFEDGAAWELWARRGSKGWSVEVRPVEESTLVTFRTTLARVKSLECATLRVPKNYLAEAKALIARQKSTVRLEATEPCWPEQLGQCLAGAVGFANRRSKRARST